MVPLRFLTIIVGTREFVNWFQWYQQIHLRILLLSIIFQRILCVTSLVPSNFLSIIAGPNKYIE